MLNLKPKLQVYFKPFQIVFAQIYKNTNFLLILLLILLPAQNNPCFLIIILINYPYFLIKYSYIRILLLSILIYSPNLISEFLFI